MPYSFLVFFEALFFIYTTYIAGLLFLQLFKINFFTPIKQNTYALLSGYGVYMLVGFTLAILGKFDATYLWIITLLFFVLSIFTIKRHIHFLVNYICRPHEIFVRIHRIFRDHTLLKLVIIFWITFNFFLIFVPITAYDTLDYHLPIMLDIIKEKKLTFTPDIRQYSALPVFGEIMYAVPTTMFGEATKSVYSILDYNNTTGIGDRKKVMSHEGPFIFQIIQYSVIILLVLLLYEFLRNRVKNEFLIPVSSLLLLSIFDLWREVLHSGYIDVFVFIFSIASLLIVIDNCCEKNLRGKELFFSAFLLGISLGIKYIALFFAFTNVILLVIYWKKHGAQFREALLQILRYVSIAVLLSGFWYLKNIIKFQNPVYPMFSVSDFNYVVNEFIVNRSIVNFILFPFYRYGQWFISTVESSSRLVVFIYYVILYSLGIFFLVVKRRFSLIEKLLVLSVVIITGLLFISSHIYRFLLPSVILIIPLLVLFTDKFYIFLEEHINQRAYQLFGMISKTLIYIILLSVFLVGNFHFWQIRFTYVIGGYSVEEYVRTIGGL